MASAYSFQLTGARTDRLGGVDGSKPPDRLKEIEKGPHEALAALPSRKAESIGTGEGSKEHISKRANGSWEKEIKLGIKVLLGDEPGCGSPNTLGRFH